MRRRTTISGPVPTVRTERMIAERMSVDTWSTIRLRRPVNKAKLSVDVLVRDLTRGDERVDSTEGLTHGESSRLDKLVFRQGAMYPQNSPHSVEMFRTGRKIAEGVELSGRSILVQADSTILSAIRP